MISSSQAAINSSLRPAHPTNRHRFRFSGKKVPGTGPFKEFLIRDAEVPDERGDLCIEFILQNAKTAGLTRSMKGGGDWVDLAGAPKVTQPRADEGHGDVQEDVEDEDGTDTGTAREGEDRDAGRSASERRISRSQDGPKKVFIAHGKDRVPLEQLKKTLDQFKSGTPSP